MRKSSNATTVATPTLSVGDRAYNAALDHGAVTGAHAHIIARASVEHMKRGSQVATGYTTGFATGFLAGWRSVK